MTWTARHRMVRPGYWIAYIEHSEPTATGGRITRPCPHQYHSRNDLALACARRMLATKENQP